MKKKGKKALTTLGAVVAAGLTPGFIAATPGCLPGQGTSAGTTAAEVVAIDGQAYSFDELYAMQQPDTMGTKVELPEVEIQALSSATKYGIRISPDSKFSKHNKVKEKADIIFHSVEQMPQFPGGEAALVKYVQSHIKYPRNAAKNNIQGRVIVQFVVDKTGMVGDVRIVRSVDKDLDKEAIRVVKALPKFTPGRQNGKAVSVWHTLPVTFKLPQKNKN